MGVCWSGRGTRRPPSHDHHEAAGPRVVYLGGLGRTGSTLVERLTRGPARRLRGGRARPPMAARHRGRSGAAAARRSTACPFWQQAGKRRSAAGTEIDPGRIAALAAPGGPEPVHPAAGRAGRPGRARRPALDEYTSYYAAAVRGDRRGQRVRADDRLEQAPVAGALPALAGRRRPAGAAPGPGQPGGGLLLGRGRCAGRTPTGELHDPVLPGGVGRGPVERPERRVPPAAGGVPVMRLRYEDLAAGPGGGAAPDRGVRRAARAAQLRRLFLGGGPGRGGPNSSPGTACRATRCGSPPGRSRSGGTSGGGLRCRPAQRREVTALTLPLLAAYGYLGARP